MSCEGVITSNLTFDGASKGLVDLKPEIVIFRWIPMLLKGGVEQLPVYNSDEHLEVVIGNRGEERGSRGTTSCHDGGVLEGKKFHSLKI